MNSKAGRHIKIHVLVSKAFMVQMPTLKLINWMFRQGSFTEKVSLNFRFRKLYSLSCFIWSAIHPFRGVCMQSWLSSKWGEFMRGATAQTKPEESPKFCTEKVLRYPLKQRQYYAQMDAAWTEQELFCICVCFCVCLHLRKSNKLLFNFLYFSSPTFCVILFLLLLSLSLFFSGGNISTYPGHCGFSAKDHQLHSHHNGSRACPNCKNKNITLHHTCVTFSHFVYSFNWSNSKNNTPYTVCYAISFWNTKYVNTSTCSLKYTLLLYIQEEDQEERGIVGSHRLLWLISKSGVIQDSNLWQLVTQKQLK